jgi:hypothetical protein
MNSIDPLVSVIIPTYNWSSSSDNLTGPEIKSDFYSYGRAYIDLYIKNKKRELNAAEKDAVEKSLDIIKAGEQKLDTR